MELVIQDMGTFQIVPYTAERIKNPLAVTYDVHA